MAVIVQKYGGTSLGSLERIQNVAAKIALHKQQGHDIVVIVSAMAGDTDKLIQLANKLSQQPCPREYDALIATGEQVSTALLAIALIAKHCPACSLYGQQTGIHTDSQHSNARILDIDTNRITAELQQGKVVIVAGFQGVDDFGNITTLGRGGSDTTAVALAITLAAQECQIYTDVDGVYTADPHVILAARLIPVISFNEMLEMAYLGAKVLQVNAVELASKYNIPIRVLSSFHQSNGTLVTEEVHMLHKPAVTGITFNTTTALITIAGLANSPGIAGYIFGKMFDYNITIDLISQSTLGNNNISLTFSVDRKNFIAAWNLVVAIAQELTIASISNNPNVAKLAIVGAGLKTEASIASTMFQVLGQAGIDIYMISSSEISIAVIIDEANLEAGANALHQAFGLTAQA
jgi:aspartate kinase